MLTRLQQRILLLFSRNDACESYHHEEWGLESALALLERVYTNFFAQVRHKFVCDFGCGVGQQCIALACAAEAQAVLGIDTNPRRIGEARKLLERIPVGKSIEFSENIDASHYGRYDVVISQNSMEHFPHPKKTLNEMKLLLKKDGQIFITFGPPWYAPYGAHMKFFTRLPWVHLFFSENAVMNVRRRYRQDGARRYEEVESGLNKMSVAKFERIIKESGLRIVYKNYECVKGLRFLGKIPVIRELFINHVSVALAVAL